MQTTVLANREDVREIEEELKYDFIIHILENMGIPPEVLIKIFPEGGYQDFDVKSRIRLREEMKKFDVRIVDDRDGGIKIYVDDDMVAEWKKAKFALRRNSKAKYDSEKFHAEITVNFWTIFDDDGEDLNE